MSHPICIKHPRNVWLLLSPVLASTRAEHAGVQWLLDGQSRPGKAQGLTTNASVGLVQVKTARKVLATCTVDPRLRNGGVIAVPTE